MADAITIKALQDASLDAKSLEEVVNGNESKQVTTRLGETYPSVKKAVKTLFENGGLPATPFATKALMTASALVNGDYAQVTDDTVNNGLYVKTAGAWVKSEYDPSEKSLRETQSIVWLSKYNEHTNLVNTGRRLGHVHSTSSGVIAMEGAVCSYPIQVNEGDLIIAKVFKAPSSYPVVCLNDLGEYTTPLFTGDVDGYYRVIPSGVKYIVLNLDASKIDECYVYNLSNERLQQQLNVSQAAQQIVRIGIDIAKEIPEETGVCLDKGILISLSAWNTSGYIPVKPLSIYSSTANSVFGGVSSIIKGVHYYDVDKNILSFGKVLMPYETFTTPKDCAFVRISYAKATSLKDKLEVYEGSTLVSNRVEDMVTSSFLKYGVVGEVRLSEYYGLKQGIYIGDGGTAINSPNWSTTGFAPVFEGQLLRYEASTNGVPVSVAGYDDNKQFVSELFRASSALELKVSEIVMPAGIYYVRASFYNLKPENITLLASNGDSNTTTPTYVSRHKGKTLVTLGTSIVDSIATPTTYPKYVREKMGLVHYEHASSGSRTRESLVKRSANLDANLLAADFITLDHGTNDFKLETSLGAIEDPPTDSLLLKDASGYANGGSAGGTFIADIKGIIEYIYNVNPSAKILLITPIRRSQPASNGTDTNSKGHTLSDYANAIISIAKLYAIPVLDNHNESGFNERTIPTWTKDGLHPTDWAQEHILANKVIGFLESN